MKRIACLQHGQDGEGRTKLLCNWDERAGEASENALANHCQDCSGGGGGCVGSSGDDGGGGGCKNGGHSCGDTDHGAKASRSDQGRLKKTPWTEEEHR